MKPLHERVNWEVKRKDVAVFLDAMRPILPLQSVANIMGISQQAAQLIEWSAISKIVRAFRPEMKENQ